MTRIFVTQDDLDHGVARDCSLCPVARALKRAFPGLLPSVGIHRATLYRMPKNVPPGHNPMHYVTVADTLQTMSLPAHVADAVYAVDNGLAVQPFEFTWELDDQ